MALQVKFQVDGLCEQLRRTKIHFVHCFLPQHGAGLCDVKSKTKVSMDEGQMNVPLVRSQVPMIKKDYLDVDNFNRNIFDIITKPRSFFNYLSLSSCKDLLFFFQKSEFVRTIYLSENIFIFLH